MLQGGRDVVAPSDGRVGISGDRRWNDERLSVGCDRDVPRALEIDIEQPTGRSASNGVHHLDVPGDTVLEPQHVVAVDADLGISVEFQDLNFLPFVGKVEMTVPCRPHHGALAGHFPFQHPLQPACGLALEGNIAGDSRSSTLLSP